MADIEHAGTNMNPSSNGPVAQVNPLRNLDDTVGGLKREAFEMTNYHFIFQGVVFAAFYRLHHSITYEKCKYIWIPMTLSTIAGVSNLIAFHSVALKYKAASTNSASVALEASRSTFIERWRLPCYVICMGLLVAFLVTMFVGYLKVACDI